MRHISLATYTPEAMFTVGVARTWGRELAGLASLQQQDPDTERGGTPAASLRGTGGWQASHGPNRTLHVTHFSPVLGILRQMVSTSKSTFHEQTLPALDLGLGLPSYPLPAAPSPHAFPTSCQPGPL